MLKKTPNFLMPRLISNQSNRTHPLVWLVAIIFALLVIGVILMGIVVFIVYMNYKPMMPYVQVAYAHLDKLEYNQFGHLNTQITLKIMAINNNAKANASFYDLKFDLWFQDIKIAELTANPFKISKNSSLLLNYIVQSSKVPLDKEAMNTMDVALKQEKIPFRLDGYARTRWRVGIFASLKFWIPLSCKLEFTYSNGNSIGLDCNSKSD